LSICAVLATPRLARRESARAITALTATSSSIASAVAPVRIIERRPAAADAPLLFERARLRDLSRELVRRFPRPRSEPCGRQ
jgi:hypothetical protein